MPVDQTTLDRMVTEGRAASVARALFPEDFADGLDCMAEVGRQGKPCYICASRNEAWRVRVAQVRQAIQRAFS